MRRFKKSIYFILGFSTTTPLLSLVVGGHLLSLMTFVLLLSLVDLFLSRRRKLMINKESKLFKLFLVYLLLCFLSSSFGAIYFCLDHKEYSLAQIYFLPKILIYLLFLLLLNVSVKRNINITYILRGIKFGAIVNLIWCILDAFIFYTTRISITNDIFSNVIEAMDLPNLQASIIEGLFIRSSGLTIDQCFIGYYATALTIYGFIKNRKLLILLSLVACFASVSIIGLVGILFAIVFFLFKKKNKIKNLAIISSLAVLLVIVYDFSENEMIDNFSTAVELRLRSKADKDASATTRLLFVEEFPGALMNLPTALLFGTGYFSASYAYFQQGLVYAKYNRSHMHPVPIENMYIETLFAVGFIGLFIFVLFYMKIITATSHLIRLPKNDENALILYTFTLGAMILFMFYHNVFDSTIMLLSICAASSISNPKEIQMESKVN